MATGPLPDGITSELEELKHRLAMLGAADLSEEETRAMAAEISAIRLQLKRLAFDQQAMRERARGPGRASPARGAE